MVYKIIYIPIVFVKHPFSKYLWVNKDGQIWNQRYRRIVGIKNSFGYVKVSVVDKRRPAHQIVLETFVGKCPKGMEACHNNGIRDDNRLENLRWGTRSSNQKDSVKHGTHNGLYKGEKHSTSKLIEQDVRMIIELYKHWYYTQKEIAEMYDITQANVSSIINKKSWKHIWRN